MTLKSRFCGESGYWSEGTPDVGHEVPVMHITCADMQFGDKKGKILGVKKKRKKEDEGKEKN
jgi:hypothetical protein